MCNAQDQPAKRQIVSIMDKYYARSIDIAQYNTAMRFVPLPWGFDIEVAILIHDLTSVPFSTLTFL